MTERGPFHSWTVWAKGRTDVRYTTERAAFAAAHVHAERGRPVKVIERVHRDLDDQLGSVVRTTPVHHPRR